MFVCVVGVNGISEWADIISSAIIDNHLHRVGCREARDAVGLLDDRERKRL